MEREGDQAGRIGIQADDLEVSVVALPNIFRKKTPEDIGLDTVVTGILPSMKVAQEETFGPLAPLFKFDTEDEVIAMANNTIFGLASYFYARDIGRITRVQEALEYGMVGVNTGLISTEVAPLCGVKESGFGREGSKYGILDYTELKYLCISI